MKIYLVQHGKAKSKEEDAERSLSEEGKKETQKVAEFIKSMNIEVGSIKHSTKLRAIETAEILAGSIRSKNGTELMQGITPLDKVEPVAEFIYNLSEDHVFVGHMPFMEKLCSLLITEDQSKSIVAIKNSGIACLIKDAETKNFKVDWIIVPQNII